MDGLSPAGSAKSHSKRIAGLDSIRFVCALWVVFGHLGFFPAVRDLDRDHPVGMVLRALLGSLFTGPPAVIVFFIISGFCIHYPFRRARSMPGLAFLLRRYIRIGFPAMGAVLFIRHFAPGNSAFDLSATSGTVVWSLLAEVIYYTIYPLLFLMAKRSGWLPILGKTSYWAALVLFVLVGCYLFYLVAEKPSHWLGRKIHSSRLRPSLE